LKKFLLFLLSACMLSLPCRAIEPLAEESFSLKCDAAVLMERESREVIYAKGEHERLSPASVTKVMTMLLVCEAVENGSVALTDYVTASANAAAMGGSQIWLEEGERMTVSEMLKCVAVVSANDCCVALAEHLCGSEEAFVARMNKRAGELGLENTRFRNCTGLSGPGEHYSSARDIAVMSAELLGHGLIRDYTTIWMDEIRGGEFTLTNTNKLLRRYDGCTGLKTGFTDEAMFCLAASAERDGVEYIAVILHGDSSDDRFAAARTLLDYAFANYTLASLLPTEAIAPLRVEMGVRETVQPGCLENPCFLVEKGLLSALEWQLELPESVKAPVEEGQQLGCVRVSANGEELAVLPLRALETVEKQSFGHIYRRLITLLCGGN